MRTLGKKRRVVTSLLWPKALVVPAAADPNGDKTKANVVSRLYGATVVRDAVKEVVESVEGTMGLRENEVVVKPTEEDEDEGEDENEGAEEKEEEEVVVLSDREVELSDGDRVVEESEEFGGFSDTPGAAGDEKSAAPELDNDDWDRIMDPNSTDFADFEDRIGASDDEDEVEGSDEEEDESRGELERTDDEWSGSEDDEETSKPAPSKEPTANKNKKAPVAAPAPAPVKDKKKDKKVAPMPAASSKFLPSLMSGYISGGDSDPDAEYYKINGKNSGPPEKKERKNRMGQQARRALWEKKFGKEANHVKSAEEEAREKRERRDAKRLRNGLPAMGEKKPEKEGPLHPSWEAARMAKEKQAKMAEAMFKPQGKKITFD